MLIQSKTFTERVLVLLQAELTSICIMKPIRKERLSRLFYSNTTAAYKDIEVGRLDATGISRPQGLYLIKQGDVTGLKVTGYNGITETDIFPMLKGENEELLEMANKTIKEMKEDGSLAELAVKWFGDDVTVNPDEQ